MLKELIDWYLGALDTGGYLLIALLMAIESSIVPLPSELVIPPAAILAHQGKLSMVGIIIAGTIGSWIGATLMYWVSRVAGRPLVLRYGRYFFISPEKVQAAERWAERFGAVGVFISRLLPVVRHLIGIPAGVTRLSYKTYSIYTLLGSAIWCSVLCWVGVVAGKDEELLKGDVRQFTLWAIGAILAIVTLYYFLVHRFMKHRSKP